MLTILAIVSVVACLAYVGIEETNVPCDQLNKAQGTLFKATVEIFVNEGWCQVGTCSLDCVCQ